MRLMFPRGAPTFVSLVRPFSQFSLRKQPTFREVATWALTKIWVVHVISMEFLRSLLRRRFERAQVATSRKVGCFLRLETILREMFSSDVDCM